MEQTKGKYPNTFYRVSLKAIIRNEQSEVLCVKESGSQWSLPGGGIDHGESDRQALTRELYEEALITAAFDEQIVGVDSMYLETREAFLLWLVYELRFVRQPEYGVGVDADEVAYMNPHDFKDSPYRSERMVYKWCVDRSYDPHFGDQIDIHD